MDQSPPDVKARLAQVAQRFRRGISPAKPHLDLTPGCPFGAVLEQRVRDLEQNFVELRGRVYGVIFLVLGTVLLEIVLRLVNWPR